MHIFERLYRPDFFDYISTELGYSVQKESDTHFSLTLKDGKMFDFSVVTKSNIVVIGFPFQVMDGIVKRQYNQTISYSTSPIGIDELILAISRRVFGYVNGDYTNIENSTHPRVL